MILTRSKQFLRDESGATAIEYGLIAAGIAVAIMGTVATLGEKLDDKFLAIQTGLNLPPKTD